MSRSLREHQNKATTIFGLASRNVARSRSDYGSLPPAVLAPVLDHLHLHKDRLRVASRVPDQAIGCSLIGLALLESEARLPQLQQTW